MPAVEQLGQSLLAAGSVENIILADPLPGQIPTPLAEAVAQASEFLLLSEQLPAGGEPFLARDDLMVFHHNLHLIGTCIVAASHWNPPAAGRRSAKSHRNHPPAGNWYRRRGRSVDRVCGTPKPRGASRRRRGSPCRGQSWCRGSRPCGSASRARS